MSTELFKIKQYKHVLTEEETSSYVNNYQISAVTLDKCEQLSSLRLVQLKATLEDYGSGSEVRNLYVLSSINGIS